MPQRALHLWEAIQYPSLLPDGITYSACVTGKVQLRGLLPNLITHNAAISACEKGQKPQQARISCSSCSLEASCPT